MKIGQDACIYVSLTVVRRQLTIRYLSLIEEISGICDHTNNKQQEHYPDYRIGLATREHASAPIVILGRPVDAMAFT